MVQLSLCLLVISSTWHCNKIVISPICYFITILIFHQLAISWICHFTNLIFHQLAISPFWYFINLPFHQFDISSTCHFINFHFPNLPLYSFPITSTCCFIDHYSKYVIYLALQINGCYSISSNCLMSNYPFVY